MEHCIDGWGDDDPISECLYPLDPKVHCAQITQLVGNILLQISSRASGRGLEMDPDEIIHCLRLALSSEEPALRGARVPAKQLLVDAGNVRAMCDIFEVTGRERDVAAAMRWMGKSRMPDAEGLRVIIALVRRGQYERARIVAQKVRPSEGPRVVIYLAGGEASDLSPAMKEVPQLTYEQWKVEALASMALVANDPSLLVSALEHVHDGDGYGGLCRLIIVGAYLRFKMVNEAAAIIATMENTKDRVEAVGRFYVATLDTPNAENAKTILKEYGPYVLHPLSADCVRRIWVHHELTQGNSLKAVAIARNIKSPVEAVRMLCQCAIFTRNEKIANALLVRIDSNSTRYALTQEAWDRVWMYVVTMLAALGGPLLNDAPDYAARIRNPFDRSRAYLAIYARKEGLIWSRFDDPRDTADLYYWKLWR